LNWHLERTAWGRTGALRLAPSPESHTLGSYSSSRALVSLPFILALASNDPAARPELVACFRQFRTSGVLLFLGLLLFLVILNPKP
jgi:hypothetical protein